MLKLMQKIRASWVEGHTGNGISIIFVVICFDS